MFQVLIGHHHSLFLFLKEMSTSWWEENNFYVFCARDRIVDCMIRTLQDFTAQSSLVAIVATIPLPVYDIMPSKLDVQSRIKQLDEVVTLLSSHSTTAIAMILIREVQDLRANLREFVDCDRVTLP